jgi:acyl carrier protein
MSHTLDDSAPTTPQQAEPPQDGQVVDRIIAVLAEIANCEPSTLDADTALFTDLGVDSSSILELLMRLEDELGFEFDSGGLELGNLQTPAQLAAAITPLLAS